ncbi:hypothetical protein BV898_14854 [Hypsibius exemplaris]|uniref:LRAT domain-containing protein n=1 Tax=Hypsibius exemplaris TaxID=2072580 RepID=A0A9X6NCX3_HYPEX|nr:hypothetical protein BV898_14854 [Hypsibius exemplaris]
MAAPATAKAVKNEKQAKTPVANRDLSPWVSPDLWEKHKGKFEPGDLVEFRREGKLFQHWGLYLGDNLVVHVSSFDLCQPFAGFSDRFTNISSASTNASFISVAPVVAVAEAVEVELKEIAEDVKELFSEEKQSEPLPCARCEDVVVEASPLDLGYRMEDRTKWFIKVEHILRIAGRDQFRVNNIAQRTYKRAVRTPKEIFQLVKCFKDKEVDYSLVNSNCEHFVTSLKFKTEDLKDAKEKNKDGEDADVIPVVMNSCGTSSQVRQFFVGLGMVAVAVGGYVVVSLLFGGKPVPSAKVVALASKKAKVSTTLRL